MESSTPNIQEGISNVQVRGSSANEETASRAIPCSPSLGHWRLGLLDIGYSIPSAQILLVGKGQGQVLFNGMRTALGAT